MKIKHIIVSGLLIAATLSGCSQGYNDEVGITPTQTADIIEVAESGADDADNISFSAGDVTQLSIDSPQPTQSVEPTATATVTPTQSQGKSSSSEGSATPKPVVTPKPSATPKPTETPKPAATPTPTETVRPTHTPAPTPTPTPAATPEPPPSVNPPSSGRTICNTCGADITGKVAAHGDSHLLNGENFSYRVE